MKKLGYDVYALGAGMSKNKDNNNLYVDGDIQNGEIKNITVVRTNDKILLEKPDVDEDLIEYLEEHKEIEFNNNESCLEETFVVDSASKWNDLSGSYIRTSGDGLEFAGNGVLSVFKNAMYQILIFPEGSTGEISDYDDNRYTITMKETVRADKLLAGENTWAVGTVVPSSKYELVRIDD